MNSAQSFSVAMSRAGIEPPLDIISDGKIHRFHIAGDKSKSLNGWYVLYDSTPAAGAFGDWKRGISETWCSKEYRSLTTAEKARLKATTEAIIKQREAEQALVYAECRKASKTMWDSAGGVDPKHAYIIKKGIKPKGIRQLNNLLLIPVKDYAGTPHGLQIISPDGTKKFKTGTLKTGNFFIIQGATDKPILICEGYATGASLHEAIGYSVAVAFDAGNLLPVAKVLREKLPDRQLIVCADDDWTAGNPGLTKATAAAKEIGALLAIPGFKDTTNSPTDFNDLHLSEGLDAVRVRIEAAAEPEAEGKTLLSSLIKWNDIEALITSTEYLLDRLIPEGAITLLFGRGGIGKTSLTLQVVHAIAEGKAFAGLQAKQTPVTYIDLENPLSVLKDRIKHIGQSGNILIWHGSCEPSPARLDRNEYIQYLDLPKGLIVFDTLRASFLGDENSSRDIAVIIDRLKQLRDKGYTILLLHHTPKSNDAVYKGSTAILDLVDHALCLEPIKQSEDEEIDFDPERIYKFGVKIKTRFEPFSMHLQFDPEIKGFCVAKDPANEIIDAISGLLQEKGELTTNQLFEFARQELNLKSKGQVLKLLKKNEGVAWEVETKGRAKYYRVQSPDHRARLWTIGQSISPEATEPEKAQTLASPIESYSPEGVQTIGLYSKSSVQGNEKNSHSPDRCIDLEFAEILP